MVGRSLDVGMVTRVNLIANSYKFLSFVCYSQGDQASIVGGAIDFVKELEQLLQSLQAQKQMQKSGEEGYNPVSATPFSGFFSSPQYTAYSSQQPHLNFISNRYLEGGGSDSTAESSANIEVTVIQTHVNLKILSRNRPGQLLRAIAALEDLFLTILHLNVTSLEHSVLYSFSLKVIKLHNPVHVAFVFWGGGSDRKKSVAHQIKGVATVH